MLNKIFNLNRRDEPIFAVASINARIMPITRGELFEDPLQAKLEGPQIAEVTGGGTMQSQNGEIEYCDIEIQLKNSLPETIKFIIHELEGLGAAKGSRITSEATGETISFGQMEGLALYLNGTDLPAEVYQESDVNLIISELSHRLGSSGKYFDQWQGPTETALYFYGKSFTEMVALMQPFIDKYPLCQKSRVTQIA